MLYVLLLWMLSYVLCLMSYVWNLSVVLLLWMLSYVLCVELISCIVALDVVLLLWMLSYTTGNVGINSWR